ncbi:MAG: sugar transferase [Rhodospirillales bacterium]|nr:sugar transferase [Rhodospirillales bacterium]
MKKEVFDFVGAGFGLILAALPMTIIAGAVKLKMGSPVIFRQQRLGLNGKPFTILKFRTMEQFDRAANGIAACDTQRVTPLGKFLRHYRLDELPQFVNVLKGDMSLVGPRPRSFMERDKPYRDVPELRTVRPGLTSPAIVEEFKAGKPLSPEATIAKDLEYCRTLPSVRNDLRIMFETLRHVHRGTSATVPHTPSHDDLRL